MTDQVPDEVTQLRISMQNAIDELVKKEPYYSEPEVNAIAILSDALGEQTVFPKPVNP